MQISRRGFMGAAAGAALFQQTVRAQTQEGMKACVIGDTARGGYGHSLHKVFELMPNVRVAGLSDPNEAEREKHAAEAKAERSYADYREMLEKERPQLVAIGPRWTENHLEYMQACAAIGAHGIMEKPLAGDLVTADAIVSTAEAQNLKWGIGYNFRVLPELQFIRKAVMEDGLIGDVLEIRGRGKEDHRAGGEDLMVLGTHIFDMMRFFLGDAQWVSADITVDGRMVTREDAHEATEPIGPIAGDRVHATFGFAGGINGYFASTKNADGNGGRWGMDVFGSKGVASIRQVGGGCVVALFPSRSWSPSREASAWKRPEGIPRTEFKNQEAERYLPIISSVVAAIGTDALPLASIQDGHATIEMIQGVYAAHLAGRRLALPLAERKHPLLA